ncbi:lactococcin 972 family bacteriocin [Staphylococcus simulans]|uniref:lactococcin 972 family bacteriocin n=1 Tax=Staphylococcus simulans TaxID=1286 RepID=UPI0021CF8EBE|nr:lactococcin 972 family bacteriocin [Staphylococcus simulans]UXV36950.1 lactococcin 972 family bacteriocin [Staphylococcus simulans]UXV39398.1 lactococcin 972 family bacteriocin [Staphylococcus simulans]
MKKYVARTIIIATLLLGMGTTTIANAYEWAEGGKWSHGIGSTYVWSYYTHNSYGHDSTAIGKYRSDSGYTTAEKQARASAEKAWWGNQAYYRVY